MHPVLTHVPPNLWRSIMATAIPALANRAASGGPACPVPIMIASKCRDTRHLLQGRSQASARMQCSPRAAADDNHGAGRLLGQLFAGLLRYHVGGVPVWPVRIALARALLVLAVGCLRTPECAGEIGRRCEGRAGGVDEAGQPRGDFLAPPAVR